MPGLTPETMSATGALNMGERLLAQFQASGACRVEPGILQPARVLLDLYGEDIRSRTYVTADALRGEQMLRPDFTVPVALQHLDRGTGGPARYCYLGTVFRRQEADASRPNEFLQVGMEVFDDGDPIPTEVEVFAMVTGMLKGRGAKAETGDIGILRAAITGLALSERRKAELLRHIWRPRRFERLAGHFASRGGTAHPALNLPGSDAASPPHIGLRSSKEIAARVKDLRVDALEQPLPGTQRDVFAALLRVDDAASRALTAMREMVGELRPLAAVIDRFEARLDALCNAGIEPGDISFATGYGRASMEYYDGFVFGFYAPDKPESPLVASGGRYDALMWRLGADRNVGAFGAAIRPGLLADSGYRRAG